MLCSVQDPTALREGCHVTLPNSAFEGQLAATISPKKTGFLDNLMRRNSPKKEDKEAVKSPSWSIFSKKSTGTVAATSTGSQSQAEKDDLATAELIEQLLLEGRDEAEIQFHLSHIHDSHTMPTPSPPQQQRKGSTNIFSQFFRDVQTAFKEEFGVGEVYIYPEYPEFEDDLRRLTVSISSAPFFGALPPDTDLSYEQLASLEPVYVGSKCINNLPCCVHDGSPLPGDQTKCPVCLNDFAEREELKSLPCVHFFHKDCIDSWLLVGHTCPVCKLLVE